MNKCSLITILVLVFTTLSIFSQKPQKWTERIFFGGNLGLQFGTITAIDLSPQIGYRITPKWSAGTGFSYQYYSDKRYAGFEFKTEIYGARVFTSYEVYENILAYTEYEALNLESRYFKVNALPDEEGRFWSHNLFVGGGYSQPIGKRAAIFILVLYNLNENLNSPYQNPLVRIGFNL